MAEKIMQFAKLLFLVLSVFGLSWYVIFPPNMKTIKDDNEKLRNENDSLKLLIAKLQQDSKGSLTFAEIQSGINQLPSSTQLDNLLQGTRFEKYSYNCKKGAPPQQVGPPEVKNWLSSQSSLTLSTVASWNNKLQQELNGYYLKNQVKIAIIGNYNQTLRDLVTRDSVHFVSEAAVNARRIPNNAIRIQAQ